MIKIADILRLEVFQLLSPFNDEEAQGRFNLPYQLLNSLRRNIKDDIDAHFDYVMAGGASNSRFE